MLIRTLHDCPEIIAGDQTRLRELLHPDRDYPFDGRYSLAQAVVNPGESSQPHRLISSEVYFVLSGKGEMHIDEETTPIGSGDAVVIPPDAVQWVENRGEIPLVFLCIVDPRWRAEDETILP